MVPLGTPLLAGPGAIVATMLAVQQADRRWPGGRRRARAARDDGRGLPVPPVRRPGARRAGGVAGRCWPPASRGCCSRRSPCRWSPTRPVLRHRRLTWMSPGRVGASVRGAAQQVFEGMPQPLLRRARPSPGLPRVPAPLPVPVPRPASPPSRPQRAHTSVGLATHNALRDWWDLPRGERTASGGAALLRKAWIETGFRDDDQSGRWRPRRGEVRPTSATSTRTTSRAGSSAPSRCGPTAWCSTAASTASTSRDGRARHRRLQDQPRAPHRGGRAHVAAVGPVCRRGLDDVPAPRCGSSSTTCPPARSRPTRIP